MRYVALWILCLSLGLAFILFQVKHHVVHMEEKLVAVEQMLVEERNTLHVLEAEWGHLNDPLQLDILVHKYLREWQPLSPYQIASLKDIPFRKVKLSIPDNLFHSQPKTGKRKR